MVQKPNLFFFIQHQHASFEEAVKEIKITGIKPVSADSLDLTFQHILFYYTDPNDFRKDYPGYKDHKVVAIKVTLSKIEEFGRGSLENYMEDEGKKAYLRMLEGTDIFQVTRCEFFEV